MNTNAVHETFRVLPADPIACRCNPPFFGRKSKNPPMAAHLRWADAMNDPERTLMRAGRERGWKDVARLAGLISMEDAQTKQPEAQA